MPDTPTPFAVLDSRTPGESMAPLAVKLPAGAIDTLSKQAAVLRCTRTALARTLLLRGLTELQAATAPQEVA